MGRSLNCLHDEMRARHLPAASMDTVASETEAVDSRVAKLEEENRVLRRALTAKLTADEVEIRLCRLADAQSVGTPRQVIDVHSLTCKHDFAQTPQTPDALSTSNALQRHQVHYLQELAWCLRKHLGYKVKENSAPRGDLHV